MFTGVCSTLPYIKSRKLKGLAVSSENRLAALGADAQTNTPAEFAAAVAAERAKWTRIVQASGARAD